VDAPVLDAALESVTRLNEQMLASGEVPSFTAGLKHGVRWKPEPPGDEHFDSAKAVMDRKWGDCDDLAPWQAATLRHTGEDPEAKAVVYKSGPKRWHAVVQRSDGTIEDPSKRAGMGGHEVGFSDGIVYPMMNEPSHSVGGAYIVRPSIAMRPFYGNWQARADLPWNWKEHMARDKGSPTDLAMVSLHQDPVAQTALTGAIDHAIELGMAAGFASESDINRLGAIADALDGATFNDLAACYGADEAMAAQQIVGSFIKKLGKVAKGIAKTAYKAARPLVKFVPGIGPMVDEALNLAQDLSSKFGIDPASAQLLLHNAEIFPSIKE